VTAAGDAPQGGPVVPRTMVSVVATVPVELVVTSFEYDGAVQLTGMLELIGAPSITVGWLGSLLHSSTLPVELSENPDPATFTTDPPVRPVSGLTLRVGLAAAEAGLTVSTVPNRTAPPTTTAIKAGAIYRRPGR
jgi:hypothetical protein